MTRGRETDEQTLQRIDALFFERYTGPQRSQWLQGGGQYLVRICACDSSALDAVVGAGVLNRLCLRSFTETILLLEYHK
jgi:hypothetical protein